MRNNMQRSTTHQKLNNVADEILEILNRQYDNKFIKIEKYSGSLRFSQTKDGKNLNQQELIYEISESRLPTIKLTESSKKADFIVYDIDNKKYYVEAKSVEDNLLCEMYNLTKSPDRVEKFEEVCELNKKDPQEVFNNFKNKFLDYKDTYINQVYDRLPDYFIYHKNGKICNAETRNEFLINYKLEMIFRHDAGGQNNKYKFERPSIVYLKNNKSLI